MVTLFLGRSRTLNEVQTPRSSTSERPRDNISSNTFLGRILRGSGSNSDQITRLEEEIDVKRNLELYNDHQITALNPRILYQTGLLDFNTVLIRSNREQSLRIAENDNVELDLLASETIKKLKATKKRFGHIGLVVIGLKGLGRKKLGTKVLVMILDKSWQVDLNKALIARMEVDLSQNGALFYCSPDILKNVNDLKNLKICLQTKGYETFSGDNIVINIGILGKVSNRSGMKYKIDTQKIVDTLASKGIKMIEPKAIDPEENAGLEWNLGAFTQPSNQIIVPEQSFVYENAEGQFSLRFANYKGKEVNSNLEDDSDDEITLDHAKMNKELDDLELNDLPVYDTEPEEEDSLDLDYALGYSMLEEELLCHEKLSDTEDVGFKISECTPKSISEIIQRKFNEHDIQDQVDDMILDIIYQGKTYEEAYEILNQYFNLPLVSNIAQGKTPISDFYKIDTGYMDASTSEQPPPALGKRNKTEFITPGPARPYGQGREAWTPAVAPYQNE